MKRYIIIFLVLFLVLSGIGIILEIFLDLEQDKVGTVFQRMGALIVILGTIIGFLDIKKITNTCEFFDKSEIQEMNAAIANNNVGLIVHYKLKLFQAADKAKSELFKYEALILISGTAIWGFGDIAYNFIINLS